MPFVSPVAIRELSGSGMPVLHEVKLVQPLHWREGVLTYADVVHTEEHFRLDMNC